MELQPEISFRGFEPTDSLRDLVQERIDRLENFHPRIMSCRVVIDLPHKNKVQGNLYHTSIDLKIPGKELAATRDPQNREDHSSPYQAVMDAFDAMEKQLRKLHSKQRPDQQKTSRGASHGLVVRLFPQQGYGFLRDEEGGEVYFDRRSVLNDDFEKLEVSDEVRYSVEQGMDGPQASSLQKVGKQGHRFEAR